MGPKCPNMGILPRSSKCWHFSDFFILQHPSHPYGFNEPLMTLQTWFFLKLSQNKYFGPKWPNMEISPQPPKMLKIFRYFHFASFPSSTCFQQALCHYHTFFQIKDIEFIPIFAILGTLAYAMGNLGIMLPICLVCYPLIRFHVTKVEMFPWWAFDHGTLIRT